uniref:Putative secreted peptide n=1 Tax=Anopheles braziliensis TaxID=58242 RepID=A0A2M3ZMD8_9DIPT
MGPNLRRSCCSAAASAAAAAADAVRLSHIAVLRIWPFSVTFCADICGCAPGLRKELGSARNSIHLIGKQPA